jgi:hypothetical protein
MQTIYRVNWDTQKTEIAILLDAHHLNEGATQETWLCRDFRGQQFTCDKYSWQFTEISAWEEYEAELAESCKESFAHLREVEKEYVKETNKHFFAKKKILELKEIQF